MQSCDICGATDKLYTAKIESTSMVVCDQCKEYGVNVKPLVKQAPAQSVPIDFEEPVETEEIAVDDFGKLIKQKRESQNLDLHKFASQVNIKASLMHKIESQSINPPLSMLKKIERALRLRLTKTVKVDQGQMSGSVDQEIAAVTIGDMLQIKS